MLAFLFSVGLSLNRNTEWLFCIVLLLQKKKKKSGAQPVGVIWGSRSLMLH